MKLGVHISSHEMTKSLCEYYPLECFACFLPSATKTVDFVSKTMKKSVCVVHSRFDTNLSSPNYEVRRLSVLKVIDEVKSCARLGIKFLVIHPGSTKGQISFSEGVFNLALSVHEVISQTQDVVLLVENMCGSGGQTMHQLEYFDVLFEITNERMGICLDTCHLWAGGYKISNPGAFKQIFDHLNRFGCGVQVVHFNDSFHEFASFKDRHACLGKGTIGMDFFRSTRTLFNECDALFILETPGGSFDRISECQEILSEPVR